MSLGAWTLIVGFISELACCGAHEQAPLQQDSQQSAIPALQFEVHPPVFTPEEEGTSNGCIHSQTLMEHTFANSYGAPFIGSYEPPPCDFDCVTINFTVFVQGRQFDRLGIMYLGDIEVFRTSTSEPSLAGVTWSYVKEMDMYNALWKKEQKIIFDLPNIVNEVYTGPLYTKLTATFFSLQEKDRKHADAILPISAARSAQEKGSAFTVPGDDARVSYKFGKKIERAVVSLAACGQQAEEFWYTNVLNRYTDTFKDTMGELGGFSPFREVQLLIDGKLAGVAWPFPVVFTGGIAPGLWRPVVGIDAYDLRQQEIDITPWLGFLADGREHTFEIKVVGIEDTGYSAPGRVGLSDHVDGFWIVTGTIFLFEGDGQSDRALSPLPPYVDSPKMIELSYSTSQDAKGANESLQFDVHVKRDLIVTADATFTQSLEFRLTLQLSSYGETQHVTLLTTGLDVAESDNHFYAYNYSYPLSLNSTIRTYTPDEGSGFSIAASLNRRLDTNTYGTGVFPDGLQNWSLLRSYDYQDPQIISTALDPNHSPAISPEQTNIKQANVSIAQNGSATYRASKVKDDSYSFGKLHTYLTFKARAPKSVERYIRLADSANSTISRDGYALTGQWEPPSIQRGDPETTRLESSNSLMEGIKASKQDGPMLGRDSPRALLGRGSGDAKQGYSAHGQGALPVKSNPEL